MFLKIISCKVNNLESKSGLWVINGSHVHSRQKCLRRMVQLSSHMYTGFKALGIHRREAWCLSAATEIHNVHFLRVKMSANKIHSNKISWRDSAGVKVHACGS